MNTDAVIAELQTIRDQLAPILEPSSQHVLSAAMASLKEQKEKAAKLPRKAKPLPWKLVITPERPLAFCSTQNEPLVKHQLEVDLACTLTQPASTGLPVEEHNIAVRVWSTDAKVCFRGDVDAATLRAKFTACPKRVMLRFHFDLANKDQQGPRHHLQIGGKGMPTDYQWLPDNWKLPRFVHVPLNLVLACEFIGRTFYPTEFARISQEPTWMNAVKLAERAYLLPFLATLPYVLKVDPNHRKESLLSAVWNA